MRTSLSASAPPEGIRHDNAFWHFRFPYWLQPPCCSVDTQPILHQDQKKEEPSSRSSQKIVSSLFLSPLLLPFPLLFFQLFLNPPPFNWCFKGSRVLSPPILPYRHQLLHPFGLCQCTLNEPAWLNLVPVPLPSLPAPALELLHFPWSTFFQESMEVYIKGPSLDMPSFPFWFMSTFPFVVLCKRVSWLDTAAYFAEGCSDAKALFHDLCGLRGRLRILLVPFWKSGLNRAVGRTSTPDGIRSSG